MTHFHNFYLVCQIFSYMILNNSSFGIATTNNSSYFFKFSMEDKKLYISDPISCIYDEQKSKISIFKSIWYVVMQAEKICLKPDSERMELDSHMFSLSDKKDDNEGDDDENNQHSTLTAAAKMQKRTRSGKKIDTNTKQSVFKISHIKDLIGYGATSTVKRYENFKGDDIAVKIVDIANTRIGFEQAKQELEIYRILNSLQGKCIPQIEFVWEHWPFLIYGMTLIQNKKVDLVSMDKKESFKIQLKCVLDKIHDLKVTHNDIRLENIIVDNDNKVWLIDFGKAITDSNENQIENDFWQMDLLLREMNIPLSTPQKQQLIESSNGGVTVELAQSNLSPSVLSLVKQANSANKGIALFKSISQDSF